MRRFQVAVIWMIVAGAATYLFLFDPDRGGYPSCPFRMLTGLQCPGCGTARGLHQLLHGHPIAAFELNPIVILLLPFLGFILFSFTRAAATGKPMREPAVPEKYGWLFFVIIVSFWVVRNTSIYPFAS